MEAPPAPPSFKIVKTKEGKGDKALTIVPSIWEKDGTMYWPKLKIFSTIMKYIKSHLAPETGPTDLVWMNCPAKVLERGIETHAEAEHKLKMLLRQDDSSAIASENENLILEHSRTRRRKKQSPIIEKDYSNMLDRSIANNVSDV